MASVMPCFKYQGVAPGSNKMALKGAKTPITSPPGAILIEPRATPLVDRFQKRRNLGPKNLKWVKRLSKRGANRKKNSTRPVYKMLRN
ncbi:MAG: hypothetical protein DRR19_32320 [Candidatus Parabeggiatoa sp. nov. 1]|nr:MAG: hypothetical protein DRR19_32320 [Gammaproteobacteria bacterium]